MVASWAWSLDSSRSKCRVGERRREFFAGSFLGIHPILEAGRNDVLVWLQPLDASVNKKINFTHRQVGTLAYHPRRST